MDELDFLSSEELKPYLVSLGALASTWTYIEHDLNEAIWEFSNVSRQAGACMTAQMIGAGPRLRCLASLMKLRKVPDAIIKEFNSLGSEIEGIGRQRNRYLHDQLFWHTSLNIVAKLEITADRAPRFSSTTVANEEIVKLIQEMRRLNGRFLRLIKRAIDETEAWPRRQYARSPGTLQALEETDIVLSKPGRPSGPSRA